MPEHEASPAAEAKPHVWAHAKGTPAWLLQAAYALRLLAPVDLVSEPTFDAAIARVHDIRCA